MKINTNKIKGKIREYGYNQNDVAKLINMSKSQFNLKLNQKYEFKLSELINLCSVLNANMEDFLL